jgi:hypothetical protein
MTSNDYDCAYPVPNSIYDHHPLAASRKHGNAIKGEAKLKMDIIAHKLMKQTS